MEIKCRYDLTPFMKREKDIYKLWGLNRALEQARKERELRLGEMEEHVSVE